MSEHTDAAAHGVGQALAALNEIDAGRGGWHEVGIIIGLLIGSLNELTVAVEELERR